MNFKAMLPALAGAAVTAAAIFGSEYLIPEAQAQAAASPDCKFLSMNYQQVESWVEKEMSEGRELKEVGLLDKSRNRWFVMTCN